MVSKPAHFVHSQEIINSHHGHKLSAKIVEMRAKFSQIAEMPADQPSNKQLMEKILIPLQSFPSLSQSMPQGEEPGKKKGSTLSFFPTPLVRFMTVSDKKGALLMLSQENQDSWLHQAEKYFHLNSIQEIAMLFAWMAML